MRTKSGFVIKRTLRIVGTIPLVDDAGNSYKWDIIRDGTDVGFMLSTEKGQSLLSDNLGTFYDITYDLDDIFIASARYRLSPPKVWWAELVRKMVKK